MRARYITCNLQSLQTFTLQKSQIFQVSDSTVGDTECLLNPDSSPDVGHINSVFSDSEFELPLSPEPEPVRSPLIAGLGHRTVYEDVRIFQVVLTLDQEVSLEAVRAIVHLIYTGDLFPFGCNAEVRRF